MANSVELSSALSFTSSSHISNGSTNYNLPSTSGSETVSTSLEIVSLTKLSCNLEQLFANSTCDYSDAEIIVEGISVGVHRCILAARSKFFYKFFKQTNGPSEKEGKPQFVLSDLLPYGWIGYEAFIIFLSYVYAGKLKPSPPEVSTCVDRNGCVHDACGPAISFAVELMYASSIFQIPELVSVFQRRLLNFIDKALVEDVIPILLLAFNIQSSQLITQCVDRIARSDLDSVALEKELPHELSENIKSLRLGKYQPHDEQKTEPLVDPVRMKRIRRIHRALDSDDVELVKLLLTESDISLDEANALHYAAAYCDPKVVSEVLNLGLANVDLQNARGYAVIHVAARRKEPSIIVSLLTKGASASKITRYEGQTAASICRSLTRPKDYDAKVKQGEKAKKDRICVDILEREMRRNPFGENLTISSPIAADDLHMKLLYLENRVAFARLFFPTEAKLAMEIANAEKTSEFAGSASKGSNGSLREVDLNETPIMQKERLHSRMEALSKTVEMGRRYFPNCSEVLDKFMEDDLPDLFYLDKGTPDERRIKRMRFMELKDDVRRAFKKDKSEFNCSGLSSSASSSSLKGDLSCKARKL